MATTSGKRGDSHSNINSISNSNSSSNSNKNKDGVFDDAEDDEGIDATELQVTSEPKRRRLTSPPASNSDASKMDESDDDEDLFDPTLSPPGNTSTNTNGNGNARRDGLSKFVRRILDPNRKPTGLIEPPRVIPLNDEFLQAFGNREKEMDKQIGRTIDIDNNLEEEEEEDDKDSNDHDAKQTTAENEANRKIKITNLKYTTTEAALKEECLNFGKVVSVNMIMDDNDSSKNAGRAYVVFEQAEAAQAAINQTFELDGRPIRVSRADEAPRRSTGDKDSRYFVRDIATKCFRCGKIGHREAECPNPAQTAVCPLCANIHLVMGEPHDLRSCPLNRVCFNCGVPGHINRDCPKARGSCPPRLICSVCCGSGHTRYQCQRTSTSAIPGIQEAICFLCGQKGHFQCSPLKWFFGLKGVFCYNCGGKGHVGDACKRPRLDDLVRNDGWAMKEIDRAEEYKIADELEEEREERSRKLQEQDRKRAEEREGRRQHYRDADPRSRSAPRPRGDVDEYHYTVGNDNRNNNSNSRNNNQQGIGGRRRGYR